jgi:hypothetical protein
MEAGSENNIFHRVAVEARPPTIREGCPVSMPGNPTAADLGRIAETSDPSAGPIERPRGRRLWPLALAAGLLAGLVSWGVEELDLRHFGPSYELKKSERASAATAGKAMSDQRLAAMTRTAMTSHAVLGGLLGLGLGLAAGRASGSWRRGLLGGLVALAVGAVGGALFCRWLVPRYYEQLAAADDLTLPLLVHLGMWGMVGLAGGLGLGLGLGSTGRGALAVVGGVVGVAFGIALVEFLGAVAFPMAETNLPISIELGSRLLIHLGVALPAALGAAGAAEFIKLSRRGPARVS